jgi:fatty acid desaturase
VNTINKIQKKPRGGSLLSKHPFALGRYYLINIGVYALATAGVLYWNRLFDTVSFWWIFSLVPLFLNRFRFIAGGSLLLSIIVLVNYWAEISWIYVLLFLTALYLGHLSAVLIHNAVHNNFKPLWLNPVIGELCALQQLSAGFPVFRFIHNEHHGHSDDPEKDPHPPTGYTFWEFVDVSRSLIQRRLTAIYLKKWGDTEKSKTAWKLQENLLVSSRFVKIIFLFSLLGPKIFVLLFLPSYLSNVFLFAAFNYFTHRTNHSGITEILNLDHNWYYKFCNKTLFGVFYHKNHHLRPKLFNPMNMKPGIIK